MKNFKPSMICIIMMLPFLVLGKTTGIDSKSELPPPVASITNNTGTTILTCTTSAISVTAIGGTSYSWEWRKQHKYRCKQLHFAGNIHGDRNRFGCKHRNCQHFHNSGYYTAYCCNYQQYGRYRTNLCLDNNQCHKHLLPEPPLPGVVVRHQLVQITVLLPRELILLR